MCFARSDIKKSFRHTLFDSLLLPSLNKTVPIFKQCARPITKESGNIFNVLLRALSIELYSWWKNQKMAALQGFEPQPTDPESVVLPLN